MPRHVPAEAPPTYLPPTSQRQTQHQHQPHPTSLSHPRPPASTPAQPSLAPPLSPHLSTYLHNHHLPRQGIRHQASDAAPTSTHAPPLIRRPLPRVPPPPHQSGGRGEINTVVQAAGGASKPAPSFGGFVNPPWAVAMSLLLFLGYIRARKGPLINCGLGFDWIAAGVS
jgi:hypothetical protein